MSAERPDVTLVRRRFAKVEDAGDAYSRLLAENDDLDCVFVAWDVPALKVLSAIREGAKSLPIVTVDLGNEIAAELRSGRTAEGHCGATALRSGRGGRERGARSGSSGGVPRRGSPRPDSR